MRSNSKRILIVDDEEDLTWSISRSLRKENQHFEIICVNSGDEAIEILKRISLDLIISDVRMPEKDGLMLVQYARKINPEIKVIIMSAWYGPEIKDRLTGATGVYYIEKPFDIRELKRIIYRAVQKQTEQHDSCFNNQFDTVFKDVSLKKIALFGWKNLVEQENT